MRSDNLVPVLAAKPPAGMGARKAVIVAWNQETAENLVLVSGKVFENLPILNTSEAAILAADDIVTVITFGNSWAILGRLTIPGTPEAVSALSALRTQSNDVLTSESTASTSLGDLTTVGPSVDITIGPSGRALVIVSADWTGVTQTGIGISTGGGRMAYEASGANTLSAIARYAATSSIRQEFSSPPAGVNFQLRTAMSRITLRTGLNPGLTTFTAKYQSIGGQSTTFADRNITVMAL